MVKFQFLLGYQAVMLIREVYNRSNQRAVRIN